MPANSICFLDETIHSPFTNMTINPYSFDTANQTKQVGVKNKIRPFVYLS